MIRSLLFSAGLFVLLAAWTEEQFHLHPELIWSDDFLLGEASAPLWLADELNHGKLLYRDAFTQYGALSVYSYAWFARLAGNTPESFMRMEQLEGLLAAGLAWILLRRQMKAESAALFLLVMLAPSLLPIGGAITAYLGLERLMVLILALMWKPEESSSRRWMVLVGAVMGTMQLVKFGGGIVALGAWVLADICLGGVSWRKLAWRWGAILSGYLAVTIAWAVVLLARLPRPIALDVLWPSYMLANYASYVGKQHNRWPEWFNWGFFLGVQIGPLVALGLVLGMILMILARSKMNRAGDGSRGAGAFLFLGLFFLLGCMVYLKHEWLIMAYCWALVLAAAWVWMRLPALARMMVTLLFFPGFYVHLGGPTSLTPKKEKTYYAMDLPTGDRLWGSEKDAVRIMRVKAVVDDLISHGQNQDAVLGMGLDAGWHHFFGWPAATRNGWFMTGFIRPYDEPILAASLRRTAAVIVVGNGRHEKITSDPRTWPLVALGLSDRLCEIFAERLGKPIVIDDGCWVFPVLPNGGTVSDLPKH